ncbi:hypothetical protein Y032_0562g3500 [Ancylostoma ceylanicum]|uniref:Secreted protein n=1 Tax=Ancylostoma ceylanicum TaxID=53326 RepID=A0A016WP96_9BILA|nr:hypothetical protein Y032_0562g3500 [Ancylostoma ceylanicum]
MLSGRQLLTHYLLLLAINGTYGRDCYGGVLGQNDSYVKESNDGFLCTMSLHMPCERKPKVALYSHEDGTRCDLSDACIHLRNIFHRERSTRHEILNGKKAQPS